MDAKELLEEWEIPDGYVSVRLRVKGTDGKYTVIDTYKDMTVEDVMSNIEGNGKYQVQVLDGNGKAISGGSRSFEVTDKSLANGEKIDTSDRFVATRLLMEHTKWFQGELRSFPRALSSLSKAVANTTKREERYLKRIEELENEKKELSVKLNEALTNAGNAKWDTIGKAIEALVDGKNAKIEHVIKALNEAPMDALIPGMKKMYKGMDKERRVNLIMSMFESAMEEDTDMVIGVVLQTYNRLKEAGLA